MRKQPRVLVAFPFDLAMAIRRRAEVNDRSISGETVHLVRYALHQITDEKAQGNLLDEQHPEGS